MISIIIPFYNVEKYIEQCILSVKAQTYIDFECILVDDDSTDNSYDIASKIIEDDARFHLVRQSKKGVGGARNTGLDMSKGELIIFLDGDDYWPLDFLEVMYAELVEQNVAIVMCPYKKIGGRDRLISTHKEGRYSGQHIIQDMLFKDTTAWGKLYRKELWQMVRFPEHVYFEDFATIYKIASHIHELLVTHKTHYYYRVRSSSIMATFSEKSVQDFVSVCLSINDYLGYEYISRKEINHRLIRRWVRRQGTEKDKKILMCYLPNYLTVVLKDRDAFIFLYKLLSARLFRYLIKKKWLNIVKNIPK